MGSSACGSPCSEPEQSTKSEEQCNKRRNDHKMDRTLVLNLGINIISIVI